MARLVAPQPRGSLRSHGEQCTSLKWRRYGTHGLQSSRVPKEWPHGAQSGRYLHELHGMNAAFADANMTCTRPATAGFGGCRGGIRYYQSSAGPLLRFLRYEMPVSPQS
jgi:hypothetical protein